MRERALAVAAIALLCLPTAAIASPGGVTSSEAARAASRDAKVRELRREHPDLDARAKRVDGRWEVGYFSSGEQLALVVVDPVTGLVAESWTGYQVAWKMARGYPGAFGRTLNSPYVFLPLCLLFLVGLVDWRQLRRVANLDLLVLLSFAISHFWFNRGEIGVSVPLAYAPLLYLFGRALWIGWHGRGQGVRPVWPAAWLLVAALFLLGFRAGLNVADSGTIDVGYASVVGADRVGSGEALYGSFPADVSQGDTYGPVNYFAYAPFELAWPWSGGWDDLPAAHAAAIFFDAATFVLLLLIGMRIRPGPAGRMLGATLAFAWAAYPYTAFALESNSNDTLVALLLVATLLMIVRPAARGAAIAAAGLTKFAPLLLVPLLATYRPRVLSPGPDDPLALRAAPGEGTDRGEGRTPPLRSLRAERPIGIPTPPAAAAFAAAFVATGAAVMLWPAIDPGLATVWERTIGYQAERDSPFSVWGQVPSLEPLRYAIVAAVGGLAILFAFRPRQKSLVQVAALGAALLIAAQLAAQHWFYLYIAWFFPLLLVAITGVAERGPSAARSSRPVPGR